MKILMTLQSLDIGGAETHVVELANELKARGHQVWISSNGGVYEEKLIGIRHIKLPLHNKNPFNMLRGYFGLKKLIKKENFDIVHAHARIPGFLCGMIANKKAFHFKFITTAHWVFRAIFPFNIMTNWGERVVAVSPDIEDYLIENYDVLPKDIDLTINGINTDLFSPEISGEKIKKEFNLTKKTICYVSRMDGDRSKVAFMLIDALCEMKRNDVQLLVVGGGNDFGRLQRAVQKANEILGANSVIAAGGRTDIADCIAACDVFVGVSRSALEAMAEEKNVILGGNEGYIGLLSDENYDLAKKTNFCCRATKNCDIEMLKNDLEVALKLESNKENRQLIMDEFSTKKMTDDYEVAYNKLGVKNVVISGYYGFHNMGDDSILQSIISGIGNANITVLSKKPFETKRDFGVDSVYRFNIFAVAKAMLKNRRYGNRLLISGGGSILQDVSSSKSLFYYLFIIWLGKFLGMKVFILANGVGPIRSEFNQKLTAKILNKVDYITLRDIDSKNLLEKIGVTKKSYLTSDPVFAHANIERKEATEKYFVISVRQWRTLSDDFVDVFVESIKAISSKYELVPVFVVMQPELDKKLTRLLCSKIAWAKIVEDASVNDVLDLVANSNFVLSLRLHVLIYAAAFGLPFVGINYDPKVESLSKEFGVEAIDLENFSVDNILSKVDNMFATFDKEKREKMATEKNEKTKVDFEIINHLLN